MTGPFSRRLGASSPRPLTRRGPLFPLGRRSLPCSTSTTRRRQGGSWLAAGGATAAAQQRWLRRQRRGRQLTTHCRLVPRLCSTLQPPSAAGLHPVSPLAEPCCWARPPCFISHQPCQRAVCCCAAAPHPSLSTHRWLLPRLCSTLQPPSAAGLHPVSPLAEPCC